MSTENKMVAGLIIKPARDNAPDYVRGRMSIKVAEFVTWLESVAESEWVNLDILESKAGKLYAKLDTWKSSGSAQGSTAATATTATATECDEVF
jgi:hypothetical protein